MIKLMTNKCTICGRPATYKSYTVSGHVWYACPEHEKEVAKIVAERHTKSQIERIQHQRLHELLDTNPKNFM